MTPNFAEQAGKHAKDKCGASQYCQCFLDGAEHGYRVGKAERPTKDEIADTNIENGFLREERDQLKARLEDAEAPMHYFRATIRRMGYDDGNPPPALLGDFLKLINAYFTQHPQDGAKGDL